MITAKYLSSQCWVALLQVLVHEWLQPNICHHNVGWHCYKYLCMNDYSQISVITMLGCFVTCTCAWMITTGTWWTESGCPASWEAQIPVTQCRVALTLCYSYLCMNDYSQLCHHNVGLLCYKYLGMNDYSQISVITMLGDIVSSTCAWMITAKYLSSQCWVALLQVPVDEWLQQAHGEQNQATQLLGKPKYLSSQCGVALLQVPVHEWLQPNMSLQPCVPLLQIPVDDYNRHMNRIRLPSF